MADMESLLNMPILEKCSVPVKPQSIRKGHPYNMADCPCHAWRTKF
jgi:hypothetical protein